MFNKIHDWCMRQELEYMDDAGVIRHGKLGELMEGERRGTKFKFKSVDKDENVVYIYRSAMGKFIENYFIVFVLVFSFFLTLLLLLGKI